MLADIVRQLVKQGRTIQLTPQLVRPRLPPLPQPLSELYIHHGSRYHFHFSAHHNDNARSATSPSDLEQATQDAAATVAATGDAGNQPEARLSDVTLEFGECTSQVRHKDQSHFLGRDSSKAEEGRVVDAAQMSSKRAPVNFAGSRHDAQFTQEAHDFEGLKKQAMQAAKAKNTRRKSSRSSGVSQHGARFCARVCFKNARPRLGTFATEKEAAEAHDKACIYLGKQPKNFPAYNYDADSICALTSLAMLIEKMSSKLPLPPGMFKGVRGIGHNKFVARLWVPSRGYELHLGTFTSKEGAAEVIDQGRIYMGQPPINFPDKKYDEEEICRPVTSADHPLRRLHQMVRPAPLQPVRKQAARGASEQINTSMHTRKPVDFLWRNSIEPHVQEAITMAVNAILAYLSTEKCGSACVHDSL